MDIVAADTLPVLKIRVMDPPWLWGNISGDPGDNSELMALIDAKPDVIDIDPDYVPMVDINGDLVSTGISWDSLGWLNIDGGTELSPQTAGLTVDSNGDLILSSTGWADPLNIRSAIEDAGHDISGIADGVIPYVEGGEFAASGVTWDGASLGIGISSPARKLEVLHNAGPQLRLTHTAGSAYADLKVYSSGSLEMIASNNYAVVNSTLHVWDGRVGIGRSPSATLDIDSNVTLSSIPAFQVTRTGISSSNAYFRIGNATNTDGNFNPMFDFSSNSIVGGSAKGGYFVGRPAQDLTAIDAAISIDGRRQDNTPMENGAIVQFATNTKLKAAVMYDGRSNFYAESDLNTDLMVGSIVPSMPIPTDASFQSQLSLSITDYAAPDGREAIRIGTDGTQPVIDFFGKVNLPTVGVAGIGDGVVPYVSGGEFAASGVSWDEVSGAFTFGTDIGGLKWDFRSGEDGNSIYMYHNDRMSLRFWRGTSIMTIYGPYDSDGPQIKFGSGALTLSPTLNVGAGGPTIDLTSILFPEEAWQSTERRIGIKPQDRDAYVVPLVIKGEDAYPDAATYITGEGIQIIGGAGAANSSGDAHGGNVVLKGGTGYGTGHDGYVQVDAAEMQFIEKTDLENDVIAAKIVTSLPTATDAAYQGQLSLKVGNYSAPEGREVLGALRFGTVSSYVWVGDSRIYDPDVTFFAGGATIAHDKFALHGGVGGMRKQMAGAGDPVGATLHAPNNWAIRSGINGNGSRNADQNIYLDATGAVFIGDALGSNYTQIDSDGGLSAPKFALGQGATPVVQQAHVADPSGGATVDSEARTAINSILAALEAYGLLASV